MHLKIVKVEMQIFFLKIIEMQINIRDFIKTGVWNLEI